MNSQYIILKTRLENKSLYLFFTKHAVLVGWFICFLTLLISDIVTDKLIDLKFYFTFFGSLGVLFAICQIGYSWVFPHELTIFSNKIVAVGPWNIKHTIAFDEIRTVLYNQQSTVVQKKYGVNKIFIGKSIDPSCKIQESLFNVLKEYPDIQFIESSYI